MKLVKVLAATVLAVGLVACEDRDGTVTVSNTLQLLNSKNKWEAVAPGRYSAELSASSETKVKLKLQMGDDKELKATFKVPEGAASSGNFVVPAAGTGQNYDLRGNRDIDYQDSNTTRTSESCTWYTTEQRCEWVREPQRCTIHRTCDANGQCRERQTCEPGREYRQCRNVSVPHSGLQQVEFYYRTTTDVMTVGLAQPGQANVDAEFSSTEVGTQKHYISRSGCY